MKAMKHTLLPAAALLLAMAGMASSGPVLAQGHGYHGHRHGHGPNVRFGFSIGGPIYPYWGYPRPYYYPPAIIAVPAAPPTTYIEQGPTASESDASSYWYYCRDAEAYYPYVKSCPGGWQRVTPQPPPG